MKKKRRGREKRKDDGRGHEQRTTLCLPSSLPTRNEEECLNVKCTWTVWGEHGSSGYKGSGAHEGARKEEDKERRGEGKGDGQLVQKQNRAKDPPLPSSPPLPPFLPSLPPLLRYSCAAHGVCDALASLTAEGRLVAVLLSAIALSSLNSILSLPLSDPIHSFLLFLPIPSPTGHAAVGGEGREGIAWVTRSSGRRGCRWQGCAA